MSTSAIPAILAALYAECQGLSDVAVYDGYGITEEANTASLMIGVDNPFTAAVAASTSDTSQVPATMGTPRSRDQTGSVTCAVVAWNGDSDLATARTAAYAVLAGVEGILRADPTLGLTQFAYLVCQMGDESLSQNQTDNGAYALIVFTVTFRARL